MWRLAYRQTMLCSIATIKINLAAKKKGGEGEEGGSEGWREGVERQTWNIKDRLKCVVSNKSGLQAPRFSTVPLLMRNFDLWFVS